MKANIHPEMKDCVVTCACGATFTTKSTKDKIKADHLFNQIGVFSNKEFLIEYLFKILISLSLKGLFPKKQAFNKIAFLCKKL